MFTVLVQLIAILSIRIIVLEMIPFKKFDAIQNASSAIMLLSDMQSRADDDDQLTSCNWTTSTKDGQQFNDKTV